MKIMARKRPFEIEQEASWRKDTVEESKDPDSPSESEDDTEDTVTAPSPNVSDFIIKPIVSESSSMTESERVGSESKKKKFITTTGIVLCLPKQNLSAKKLVSNRDVKGKVKNEMDSKRLSEFLKAGTDMPSLDVGMNVLNEMGGIWSEKAKEIGEKKKKWQQQILELYIKKLELVRELAKLVLNELKSQNK